ncbi:MAG: uroporphyrinogen-III C-methyltransferase [Candidatus Latescibacteria bacterium]|nr:uroporphyrinogen-III C-methyltransferase [Candidatus Latescibacterota bacterium]
MVTGRVYLVGAGPGDPGLITVKGLERLRAADCILYDSLIPERLLAEARPGCEAIHVGHRAGSRTMPQGDINRLLIEKARAGKTVVRLKGGDPFVFGRGGEECEALAEAGVPFEVVPGVTSAVAVPAYAGIPVTHRDRASSVAFVTGHPRADATEEDGEEDGGIDYAKLATGVDTLVFLMGVRNLPRIAGQLMAHGRPATTPVALIRWGTKPEQRTLTGTLGDIAEQVRAADFRPPALIVVGEVVRLRERLSWFETRPLFGRRIVVTRSREQASDLVLRLEALGAEVIEVPTLQIDDPEDWGPVDEAVRRIGEFDWIAFTSQNGVDRFLGRLFASGRDARALASVKICAIGPATASRLEAYGLRADLRPERNVAESLAEAFGKLDVRGKRVLLPRPAVAREVLPEALAGMGAEVTEVVVYRTAPPDTPLEGLRERFRSGEVDLVTFTSSSTVIHFVEMLGDGAGAGLPGHLADRVRGASIGPITSQTARQKGIAVVAEADPDDVTIPGLVRAIERYFQDLKK